MSDRAPDGQPTSNIETMLNTAKTHLEYWEQAHTINLRALNTSNKATARAKVDVERWEGYLATRLAEEAARGVTVTGL